MSFEKNVRRVEPYVAGEQPGDKDIIKLNTNECPYPPSPEVLKAAGELSLERLRLYPDMNARKLVDALARYCQVPSSRIFAGVGSDDVLSLAFMTFFNSDKPVLFPDVTYSFYEVWARLHGISYELCPLDESSGSGRRTICGRTAALFFPIPTPLPEYWNPPTP